MITKTNVLMPSLTILGLAGCLGDTPTAESHSESELTTPQGDITQQILTRAAASSYRLVRNLAYSQCMGAPTGALNEILRISTCGFDQQQRWAFVATSVPDTCGATNDAQTWLVQ